MALAGRSLAPCIETAARIAEATGRRAHGFAADVSKAADVDRLVAEVEAALGPVDILVNNAGVNKRGPIQELTEADWDLVIDTNLKGPWLCTRAIGPGMVKRGWGRIVNLGSVMGFLPLPGRTPYATSKAGIINMTRTLAVEWAPFGITVNAIAPGYFPTKMTAPIDAALGDDKTASMAPMNRVGGPEDLKGVTALFASDASAFITGQILAVDGVLPAILNWVLNGTGSSF